MADGAYSWSGNFTDLAAADQHTVAHLLVRGNAVVGTADDLLVRLARIRCVALLRETSIARIVAAAAWKKPLNTYRCDKFRAAGVPIASFESASELGYVVIAADMRGKQLSGRLIEAIVAQITEPTFATTDNPTMRNNLKRSGFTQIGNEWQGKKGTLSLWTITP